MKAIIAPLLLLLAGCAGVTVNERDNAIYSPNRPIVGVGGVFKRIGVGVLENQDGSIIVASKSVINGWKTTLQIGDRITSCKVIGKENFSGLGYADVHNLADVERCIDAEKVNTIFRVLLEGGEIAYRSLIKFDD